MKISVGVGNFVRGQFTLPQNPFAMKTGGIGDIVNGNFTIPQNPLGLGCACDRNGMGDLDFSSIGSVFDSDVAGVPMTWILGGLVVAYFVFGDRGGEYRYRKSQLKKKYPTRGGAVQGTISNLMA